MTVPEIESVLHAAPRPAAPAGLQERLVAAVRLRPAVARNASKPAPESWLRRWWPTVLIGGGIVACAAAWVTQRSELNAGLARVQTLLATPATPNAVDPVPATVAGIPPPEDKHVEIARLRAEVAQLQEVAGQIRRLTAENLQLQTQLAAQPGISTDDLEAMKAASEKALAIQCVNNLKNIGLALRVWAADNNSTFPPDFLRITNELSTPKLMVCPADSGRQAATNWAAFGKANLSYEFLAPNGGENEPNRVATRCLIHGHVGLCDGSVHMSVGDGSNLTRRLVQRDGKLYLERE